MLPAHQVGPPVRRLVGVDRLLINESAVPCLQGLESLLRSLGHRCLRAS